MEIGSDIIFISEPDTESELKILLRRKQNRNRKASIGRIGIGNGIGIQRYSQSRFLLLRFVCFAAYDIHSSMYKTILYPFLYLTRRVLSHRIAKPAVLY